MNITTILSRLEGVRQTGHGRWTARCPAHDDRSPSLSLREGDDGRVLLHCFGGCSPDDVCGAMGVRLSDLFPPRPSDYGQRQSRRLVPASDALACVAHEARVVAIAAIVIANGEVLSDQDVDRLTVAHRRITAALGVTHG